MRDPNRIHKIIGLLHQVWGRSPDLRLGQLIINLTPNRCRRETADGLSVTDPYQVEDTEWEEILRKETER